MVPKRDLDDRTLKKALKEPAEPGKRYFKWDAQVPGFGVRVTDRGSMSFVLVTRYPGAKNPAPRQIGDYPAISLATARQVAREWREDIAKGVDPKTKVEASRRDAEHLRKEAERRRKNTFAAAFEAFAEEHLSTLRTGAVVKGVIAKHVVPVLGDRPLSEITRADANELLKRLARTTPTHARRIRSYLHTFGRWSEDEERVKESPFANLKRLGKEQKRERVLADAEVRAIWRACDRMGAFGRAVRLMLATGQRRSEVGDMEWSEFDEGKNLWTLPRERTKADRAHEVPLSPLAMSILAESPRFGSHVFSTRSKRAEPGEARGAGIAPISGWSKVKLRLDALALAELKRIAGEDATLPEWHLHDLRRTCSTGMARLGVDRLVISKVLNHAEGGVTQIYDRYRYEAEKRRALELWGARLSVIVEGGDAGNVVHLAARG
jgi:integrase